MTPPAPEEETPLTLEQYLSLPHDDRWRDELVRGLLVREPRPGGEHGWVQARLTGGLLRHVEEHGAGLVLTDSGYVLADVPPTVRGPDISYISAARAPARPPRELLRIAPDIAVEILSPSNRPAEIRAKVEDYLGAGVRLVWVIDPLTRGATEYRPGRKARALAVKEELDGGDVLPGFRLRLSELFGS
jgi:Uma2 family endonuclease